MPVILGCLISDIHRRADRSAGQWDGVGHIVVLTGVDGNNVYINDPNPRKGRRIETVEWFNQKLDRGVRGCLMYSPMGSVRSGGDIVSEARASALASSITLRRSADPARWWDRTRVSSRRLSRAEFSGHPPETIGKFGLRGRKLEVWRLTIESQKPAIGGHFREI
jgi:Papain-like cysteine protease AvrRpt2